MNPPDRRPHLYGVLVTFQRPAQLATTLTAVAGQTHPLDWLVVVDNGGGTETPTVVASHAPDARYIAAGDNLGPAGGIALGMDHILQVAGDEDWIVSLDDDDPPPDTEVFANLVAFAEEVSRGDPSTAAVGLSGVRFDHRKGRFVRVTDSELEGAVAVDSIGGNQCPVYSARAIRAVGPTRPELFFAFEELELGLRLRRAGYSLYSHGTLHHRARERLGRLGLHRKPERSLREIGWRRYYSLRNLIFILRSIGATPAAVRVSALTGVAKPLANLGRDPRNALGHLRMNWRACRDGWTGRMGRTVEPGATPTPGTARERLERTVDAVTGRALARPVLRATGSRRLAVLTYHGIEDPGRFDEHLAWLARHAQPVSLDASVEALQGRRPLPPRAVLVTVDDGDVSLLESGAQSLAAHSIPAVAFVVAGLLDGDRPFWWSEVAALAVSDGDALVAELKTVPNRERLATIERLRNTSGASPPRTRQLGSDDLRTLQRAGVEIGSHSLTHPCLDRCTEEEIEEEVAGSRKTLAAVLGRPPRAFSYPNGGTDPRVRAAVERAGYETAFLWDHRRTPVPAPDRLGVSRLRINSHDSLDRLAAVVSGVHPALHRARGGR